MKDKVRQYKSLRTRRRVSWRETLRLNAALQNTL